MTGMRSLSLLGLLLLLATLVFSVFALRLGTRTVARLLVRPGEGNTVVGLLAPAGPPVALAALDDEGTNRLGPWIPFASSATLVQAARTFIDRRDIQLVLRCTVPRSQAHCERREEHLETVELCRLAGEPPGDVSRWPAECRPAPNDTILLGLFLANNPPVDERGWRSGCLESACRTLRDQTGSNEPPR